MHNAARFINQSIESVIAQTYQDWELILIDDGSTDNSVELAEHYCQTDSRIQLIKLKHNSGAAVARNTGIKVARARYIAFLDSDDLWHPDKLKKQLAFMQTQNSAFSYTAYERIDENDKSRGLVGVPPTVTYHQMLKTSVIGCLTAMYDTQVLGKVYMPDIRKRQDYGLWLKLLKLIPEAHGLQQPLAQYRMRSGSISSNKLNTATYNWRLYRDIEKLSFLKSCYYFSHYAVRGLLRNKCPGLARKLGVMY